MIKTQLQASMPHACVKTTTQQQKATRIPPTKSLHSTRPGLPVRTSPMPDHARVERLAWPVTESSGAYSLPAKEPLPVFRATLKAGE